MQIEPIKRVVAGGWVIAAVILGIFLREVTWQIWVAFVALSVLPPLALLLWWTDPAKTMSETISEARGKTWPS